MSEITISQLNDMIDRDEIRNVIGYEMYYVSRSGDIISTNYLAKGRIRYIKTANHRGYRSVCLYTKDGHKKTNLVHRLVAKSFIHNDKNYNEVNHINEVKDDNRVDNLEWCDRNYNVNYGSRTSRVSKSLHKRVARIGKNGSILKIYDSIHDTICDGFCRTHVGSCANGKRKTHGGYEWRYI